MIVPLCVVLLATASAAPSVWPQPREAALGPSVLHISPQLQFHGGNEVETLRLAYERYTTLMFPHPGAVPASALPTIRAIDVTVDDPSEAYPQLDTDEAYELTVGADGAAALSARTVYGALHGLETLSQLVVYDFDSSLYVVTGCPLRIADSPRYAHRGILMDTSRHFQPIRSLERLIDAMSYAKLNGEWPLHVRSVCPPPHINVFRIRSLPLARGRQGEFPFRIEDLPRPVVRVLH